MFGTTPTNASSLSFNLSLNSLFFVTRGVHVCGMQVRRNKRGTFQQIKTNNIFKLKTLNGHFGRRSTKKVYEHNGIVGSLFLNFPWSRRTHVWLRFFRMLLGQAESVPWQHPLSIRPACEAKASGTHLLQEEKFLKKRFENSTQYFRKQFVLI